MDGEYLQSQTYEWPLLDEDNSLSKDGYYLLKAGTRACLMENLIWNVHFMEIQMYVWFLIS